MGKVLVAAAMVTALGLGGWAQVGFGGGGALRGVVLLELEELNAALGDAGFPALAGGLTLAGFQILLPITAAALHVISSFIVIFNSARLVRFGENLAPYAGTVADRSKPVPVAT